ncbi:unnamed protein product [Prunus armeniaca]
MFTVDAKVVNTSLVERDTPSLVTTEDNMLISIPSQEEIFGVVKSVDSLSSPGPDGFCGIFYLHCWSVVGHEVVQAVQTQEVFSRGIPSLVEFGALLWINAPRGVKHYKESSGFDAVYG